MSRPEMDERTLERVAFYEALFLIAGFALFGVIIGCAL